MKKEAVLNRSTLTLALVCAAIAPLLFTAGTLTAFVASPQVGGDKRPTMTPTPVPKKRVPPPATWRSPRGPSSSDQVEAAIEKGNQARDKAIEVGFSSEMDSDQRDAEIKKQYAEAKRQYRRAALLDSRDPRPYNGLGGIFSDERRYNDAILFYQRALRLKPDWAEAHLDLCQAYEGARSYSKAIAECKTAIRLKPGDYPHFILGDVYRSAGRPSEMIEEYKMATSLGPVVHNNLAGAYMTAGRYAEAIEEWKTLLRLQPNGELAQQAHIHLPGLYEKLGNYADAIEAYKTAIKLYPASSGSFHQGLGDAYYRAGRYPEAIEEYKVAIGPGNAWPPEAHNSLGLAYDKIGRYLEAIEEFKAAIRWRPGGAPATWRDNAESEARYNLGLTYLKANDKSSAIGQYEALKNMKSDYAAKLLSEISKH